MEPIVLNVSLQVVATTPPQPLGVSLVQADRNSHGLRVRIFDGVQEIDYPQITQANLVFIRPDGVRLCAPAQISGAELIYGLRAEELEIPGTVLGAAQLFQGENKRLTTSMFSFGVVADPMAL